MNEGGWLGVISIFLTGLFALLNKRENNKHDSKMIAMQNELKDYKIESQECREEHTKSKGELEIVRKELAARDLRDKEELQRQIDTLKKQVADKKDKTDPHNPII